MRIFVLMCSLLVLAGATGCGIKEPYRKIDYYMLSYEAPSRIRPEPLPVVLLMEKFRISSLYDTTRIVYSEGPYTRDVYYYHKWQSNPAEMVTYFLARDIRQAGLVQALFVNIGNARPTHELRGTVEEFYELDEAGKWYAVIELSVTLVRADTTNVDQRILFQKVYRAKEQSQVRNPHAIAEAMSRAMAEVSGRILSDMNSRLATDVSKKST